MQIHATGRKFFLQEQNLYRKDISLVKNQAISGDFFLSIIYLPKKQKTLSHPARDHRPLFLTLLSRKCT